MYIYIYIYIYIHTHTHTHTHTHVCICHTLKLLLLEKNLLNSSNKLNSQIIYQVFINKKLYLSSRLK